MHSLLGRRAEPPRDKVITTPESLCKCADEKVNTSAQMRTKTISGPCAVGGWVHLSQPRGVHDYPAALFGEPRAGRGCSLLVCTDFVYDGHIIDDTLTLKNEVRRSPECAWEEASEMPR